MGLELDYNEIRMGLELIVEPLKTLDYYIINSFIQWQQINF